MEMEKVVKSDYFKWTLVAIAALIIVLGAFRLGMIVGFKKANFAYGWEKNYPSNFGGPRPGMMMGDFDRRDRDRGFGGFQPFNDGRFMMNPHGAGGKIIKIASSTFAIKGADNIEKTVIVGKDTSIVERRQNLSITDLKTGDEVMVMGDPNEQGQINAKFIRIFNKQ
ncbi:hypothetical protein HGA34_05735 [Candidatus Falkowbacteria bacterium]|nr:hypothetical protein [Candidatus Falkowbacteria bacterium]